MSPQATEKRLLGPVKTTSEVKLTDSWRPVDFLHVLLEDEGKCSIFSNKLLIAL